MSKLDKQKNISYEERLLNELELELSPDSLEYLNKVDNKYKNRKNIPNLSKLGEISVGIYNLYTNSDGKRDKEGDKYFNRLDEINKFLFFSNRKKEISSIFKEITINLENAKFESDTLYGKSYDEYMKKMSFEYLMAISEYLPFFIAQKESFKISHRLYSVDLQDTLPEKNVEIEIKDIVGNFRDQLISSFEKVSDDVSEGKVNITKLFSIMFLLLKVYEDLPQNIKIDILGFMDHIVLFTSRSGIKLSKLAFGNSFWTDFLRSQKGNNGALNLEKIINIDNNYPFFQKWFINFWEGQKEIPSPVQSVLNEIESVRKRKENARLSKKKIFLQKNEVKHDVFIATKEKENILYEAPSVKKIGENPANFKYEIQKPKEGFILQMQIGKNSPIEINGGEIDMENNASKNKSITVKFRFWKNKKESHEEFDWISIYLAKIPKEKTDKTNVKIEKIINNNLIEKIETKEIVIEKEEEKIEKPEEILLGWIDIFKKEGKVDQIFAGFPDKIVSNNFNICFSDDFAEFCELNSINIKINIEEKSIEFTELEGNEEGVEFLKDTIWELLGEKISSFIQRQSEILLEEAEKEKAKNLSYKQKEFNMWLDNLNREIASYKFFENARKLDQLWSMSDFDIEKSGINGSGKLKGYLSIVGNKNYAPKSREILNKLKKVGIESDIALENGNVVILGKINISSERCHEFKAVWNKKENKVDLKIEGSENLVKKIRQFFRKVFLKIFWDIISTQNEIKTIFFAEFEEYKRNSEKERLDKLWGNDSEDSKRRLKRRFENGEIHGLYENGKRVKKCSLEDLKVCAFIIKKDSINSINEGNNKDETISFKPESYILLNDFFAEDEGNEKYCLSRLNNTLKNYKEFGYDFSKYKTNGKAPFRNSAILSLLLDDLLPHFGFNICDFLEKDLNEVNSTTDNKGDTMTNRFLTEAESLEIPLNYSSPYIVDADLLREELKNI